MEKIIQLIDLDKVYWWWRADVYTHSNDYTKQKRYYFLSANRPDWSMELDFNRSFNDLLFDTDSGFLQSLEWKKLDNHICENPRHSEQNTLVSDRVFRDNTRQYHSMILAQMTSDEDRKEHLLNNALLPN